MENQQVVTPPTLQQIAEYKRTLKNNTELIELEARNWKGQFEASYYKFELAKLNSQIAAMNVPSIPTQEEVINNIENVEVSE